MTKSNHALFLYIDDDDNDVDVVDDDDVDENMTATNKKDMVMTTQSIME